VDGKTTDFMKPVGAGLVPARSPSGAGRDKPCPYNQNLRLTETSRIMNRNQKLNMGSMD
jgi:hypothetical protein